MLKDKSISVRMDSGLKEQAEIVLDQFGLNMTTVINMLFRQIVREQAIPLSLSLKPGENIIDELMLAKSNRQAGHAGRLASSVANDMERIIIEAEHVAAKV